MMYSEFCKMSGCKLSYKAYAEKFEPMYMALEMESASSSTSCSPPSRK